MVAIRTEPPVVEDAERRFLLSGVPWWTYVALRDALDTPRVHMTYLRGALELMSPSEQHEEDSKIIARLLEGWAQANDVDLRGFGSTTYRSEAGARGAEADGCYTVGPKPKDAPPHLAIEVVASNPLVDKLDVYAGLGVREVWVWDGAKRTFQVHVLVDGAYQLAERSALLPELDLALLASFVRTGESQTALVRSFLSTRTSR